MLNTIKGKIIFLTLNTFLILSFILSGFTYINFKRNETIAIQSCDYTITTLASQINKEIVKLENNVKDLALMGELYYKAGKDKDIFKYTVRETFENYKDSLGGGIWFEIGALKNNKKYNCVYAYRNKHNKVVIDKNFETEKYDYLNQNWYKEIKKNAQSKHSIIWVTPYFEQAGSNTLMMTVGIPIYDNNKIKGMATVDWEISDIVNTISKMKPTQNSFALFADVFNDYVITSTDPNQDNSKILGKSLNNISWYKKNIGGTTEMKYNNKIYISYIKTLDNGMILVVNVPKDELFSDVTLRTTVMLILFALTSILTSLIIYIVLTKNINNPINKLSKLAHEIGDGNLSTQINIQKPKEFAELAQTFNKMTNDIKENVSHIKEITKEKEKIESELSIARKIQYSVLPNHFFEDKKEFEIYAVMDTAKEVGGDFYDYFFIKPNLFAFLIADVSGKGIPAALFMMTTKAMMKEVAKENLPPKDFVHKINRKICKNNKEGYFVTMFACLVDLESGKTYLINCGHNPPILKTHNGEYKYKRIDSNLVLGAVNDFEYKIDEINLNYGDTILLYTDGVTEAMNKSSEQYGENRLINALNNNDFKTIRETAIFIKKDIDDFTNTQALTDDMTMVIFKYKGKEDIIDTYSGNAKIENYNNFNSWLIDILKKNKIQEELIGKLQLVCEEIYVNISSYAYPNNIGKLSASIKNLDTKINLIFKDSGVEYNPLQKADPDITLEANERQIGGLGIFIVKQIANKVNYKRINNENILEISINK